MQGTSADFAEQFWHEAPFAAHCAAPRLPGFLKPGRAWADEQAVSTPGQKLRKVRLSKRLALSEVRKLTEQVARSRRNRRFRVSKTRLCGIEIYGRTPSIYCLYALAKAYDCDIRQLLRFYGCA